MSCHIRNTCRAFHLKTAIHAINCKWLTENHALIKESGEERRLWLLGGYRASAVIAVFLQFCFICRVDFALSCLAQSKRKQFWRSRVDTGRDQAYLWRVINDGLGRGVDGAPVADPGLSAEAFADYFDRKVADTDGAPPPVFRDIPTSDRLSTFIPVTTDVICTMVRVATDKYSMK